MPKTKKSGINKTINFLWAAVALLTIACLGLVVALSDSHTTAGAPAALNGPSISAGAMQYRFQNGKAVKRTDAAVTTLVSFLKTKAAHEGCPATEPAYEHIAAYTSDETQVLLRYGCGAADSPMYAIKTGGVWKSLSPTNHFDTFEIPDCAYVSKYAIQKTIAPVCVNNLMSKSPQYHVR